MMIKINRKRTLSILCAVSVLLGALAIGVLSPMTAYASDTGSSESSSSQAGNTGSSSRRSSGGTTTADSYTVSAPTVAGLPDTVHVGDSFTLTPDPDTGKGSTGWEWDENYFSATFNSPATFTALREGTSTITYRNWTGTASIRMEVTVLGAQEDAGTEPEDVPGSTAPDSGNVNDNPGTGVAGAAPAVCFTMIAATGCLTWAARRKR